MVSFKLKVSSKGQIVIPKLLREKHGIKEGINRILDKDINIHDVNDLKTFIK